MDSNTLDLPPEELALLQADQELAAHIATVTAEWGASFEPLAKDPRFDFSEGKVSAKLWKPVRIGTAMAERLVFDEPTLGQLAELDRVPGEMAKTRRLLMQVCGMTEREANALGMRDLTMAGRVMDAFTAAARVTGA